MCNRSHGNLTVEERHKIQTLYDAKHSIKEIAFYLHRGYSTISRELRRGRCVLLNYDYSTYISYGADFAINDAYNKARNRSHSIKLGSDYALSSFIVSQLDGKTSPAVISRRISKMNFSCSVSKNTIYDWLYKGYLSAEPEQLPHGRHKRRHKHNSVLRVHKNLVRSIDSRPLAVLSRDSFGHWEMDTVVGQRNGKSSCLLVLTERKSRFELIYKIQNKTAASVTKQLYKLRYNLKGDFSSIFKSITVDNGVEFSDFKNIEKLGTVLYYCHPYSSWERGSNENANKLIRRHVPKGKSMVRLSPVQVFYIQNWMNNYERKLLDWKTPKEVFLQELSKCSVDIGYFI